MGKPFFITTTGRPAEEETDNSVDELSVIELEAVPAETVAVMAQASGKDIKNDKDLADAKTIILHKRVTPVVPPKKKEDKLISTSAADTSLAILNDRESVLTKQLEMSEEEKDECSKLFPDFGLSCDWCDMGWMKDKLGNLSYERKSLGWWSNIKGMLKDRMPGANGMLGLMTRCSAWVASKGISGVTGFVDKVNGLGGNIEALDHIKGGLSKFHDIRGSDGSVTTKSSTKARLPNVENQLLSSMGNSDDISSGELATLVGALGLTTANIASPHEPYTSKTTGATSKVYSTKRNTAIVSQGSTQLDRQSIVSVSASSENKIAAGNNDTYRKRRAANQIQQDEENGVVSGAKPLSSDVAIVSNPHDGRNVTNTSTVGNESISNNTWNPNGVKSSSATLTPEKQQMRNAVVSGTSDKALSMSKVDKPRLNEICDVLDDVEPTSVNMSVVIANRINNGELPETLLTKKQLFIYNNMPLENRTILNAIKAETNLRNTSKNTIRGGAVASDDDISNGINNSILAANGNGINNSILAANGNGTYSEAGGSGYLSGGNGYIDVGGGKSTGSNRYPGNITDGSESSNDTLSNVEYNALPANGNNTVVTNQLFSEYDIRNKMRNIMNRGQLMEAGEPLRFNSVDVSKLRRKTIPKCKRLKNVKDEYSRMYTKMHGAYA